MSYILEALKRSEQQRLSSGPAALHTMPVLAVGVKEFPWKRYGLAFAALIAAVSSTAWLHPWRQGGADDMLAPVAARPAPAAQLPMLAGAAEAPAQAPAPLADKPPRVEKAQPMAQVEELQVMQVKPHRSHVEAPAAVQAAPVAPVPVAVATLAVTTPAAALQAQGKEQANPAAGAASSLPPGEGKILALHELPPEILREVPAMSITGYSYSDMPRERMVGINDRLVQEGQYVAEGLKLEQITPDGLVFSYKNYRFLKKLQ